MAETVDDLTITYMEEGVETTKELDKVVLTKGAWATLMYRYQDWDKKLQDYGQVKFSIRRYQKRHGEYKQKSKFNISSEQQAQQIIDTLQGWLQIGDGSVI